MASIEKRENGDGTTSYRVKVRLKGYPVQTATFERLTDAKKWIAATESAIREGRHFKTAEAKRHTLGDAIDRYTRDVLPSHKPKERAKKTTNLAYWRNELGHSLLADVTPSAIAAARDKMASEMTHRGKLRSPATVASYLLSLSAVLSAASKEWGWIETNPMSRVRKPPLPGGRVRFLSDDERLRLLSECRSSRTTELYPAVMLALSTGMRKGEVMGLYWREPRNPPKYRAWGVVDVDGRRIVLHATKNGERRVVPLVGPALDCVKSLSKVRRLGSDLVFPSRVDSSEPVDLRTPWENALKRAGIEDFRFHDLRHSAASYLAMNGATLAEIAEVLGHKTLAMVKRYSHLSDAHVSSVVERMNKKIFG
ncbi:site-specific integrase [Methylococcus sp. ANG]|uniref:tyrosine-type recombinase/integrase n=1 Tax=Methylococcus sp. ANG TaxID=3231903 RepID=UPI003458CA38